jgi:hypothetical protein
MFIPVSRFGLNRFGKIEAKRFENKAVSLVEKEIDGWNA